MVIGDLVRLVSAPPSIEGQWFDELGRTAIVTETFAPGTVHPRDARVKAKMLVSGRETRPWRPERFELI